MLQAFPTSWRQPFNRSLPLIAAVSRLTRPSFAIATRRHLPLVLTVESAVFKLLGICVRIPPWLSTIAFN